MKAPVGTVKSSQTLVDSSNQYSTARFEGRNHTAAATRQARAPFTVTGGCQEVRRVHRAQTGDTLDQKTNLKIKITAYQSKNQEACKNTKGRIC